MFVVAVLSILYTTFGHLATCTPTMHKSYWLVCLHACWQILNHWLNPSVAREAVNNLKGAQFQEIPVNKHHSK